jgi:hypothetical protein
MVSNTKEDTEAVAASSKKVASAVLLVALAVEFSTFANVIIHESVSLSVIVAGAAAKQRVGFDDVFYEDEAVFVILARQRRLYLRHPNPGKAL